MLHEVDKRYKVSPCEVGAVSWMFQNLELEVSNCLYCCGRNKRVGESIVLVQENSFDSSPLRLLGIAGSSCLMFRMSATSDAVIRPSS